MKPEKKRVPRKRHVPPPKMPPTPPPAPDPAPRNREGHSLPVPPEEV